MYVQVRDREIEAVGMCFTVSGRGRGREGVCKGKNGCPSVCGGSSGVEEYYWGWKKWIAPVVKKGL